MSKRGKVRESIVLMVFDVTIPPYTNNSTQKAATLNSNTYTKNKVGIFEQAFITGSHHTNECYCQSQEKQVFVFAFLDGIERRVFLNSNFGEEGIKPG